MKKKSELFNYFGLLEGVLATVIIGLLGLVFWIISYFDMASDELVAMGVLLFIGFSLFIGVLKISSISVVQSIELLGLYSLLASDFFIAHIQSLRGLTVEPKNRYKNRFIEQRKQQNKRRKARVSTKIKLAAARKRERELLVEDKFKEEESYDGLYESEDLIEPDFSVNVRWEGSVKNEPNLGFKLIRDDEDSNEAEELSNNPLDSDERWSVNSESFKTVASELEEESSLLDELLDEVTEKNHLNEVDYYPDDIAEWPVQSEKIAVITANRQVYYSNFQQLEFIEDSNDDDFSLEELHENINNLGMEENDPKNRVEPTLSFDIKSKRVSNPIINEDSTVDVEDTVNEHLIDFSTEVRIDPTLSFDLEPEIVKELTFDKDVITEEVLDESLIDFSVEDSASKERVDPKLIFDDKFGINIESTIHLINENIEKPIIINNNDIENSVDDDILIEQSLAEEQDLVAKAEYTTANIISTLKTFEVSDSLTVDKLLNEYQLPSVDLLECHEQSAYAYSKQELAILSRTVEEALKSYKVSVEVMGAYPGPIITRFELLLAPGIKVSRVTGLAKDLARAMLVTSVRVVEIIDGTPYVGLEIPNQQREMVSFRELIESDVFKKAESHLTLALGKDVSGKAVAFDLAKMPHVLVAGTTGSGKSVAINTMILSLLYKATPKDVRIIMIDPKMLELSIYEGIPHLLTPVVTDMKDAQSALRWAVAEMERRYKLMSKVGVRHLAGFNQMIKDAEEKGETIRDPLYQLIEPLEKGSSYPILSTLPSIVIIIDELADMMMLVGKKVEELIARLAQKARAAGIHLVLATQRPSVDVLTGLIKANVPTRMSFQVSSRIDSRTILDQGGAEALLGNGDMLFLPSGTSIPLRAHGAFVSDQEVHDVVDFILAQGHVEYLSDVLNSNKENTIIQSESMIDEKDPLYDEAVNFVIETKKASISSVQRRFKVGYNRAARMIDQMEAKNIVSEPEGNGSRRILKKDE